MTKKKVSSKNKSSLSNRALLVSVNISQWAARKVDRLATDTVITNHNASAAAGQYNKRLLPGASELMNITSLASQARKYFYEQTLPWMTDGSRIISSKNYVEFTSKMREYKNNFDIAVRDFETAYPRLMQEARQKLGGLYREDEYPDPTEISSKFKIESNYMPLPDVKDFRVNISETERKEFERKMKEVESLAMRDCWDRLHTVVKTAAEKLAQPDAVFRDSLIENISEIIELLPKLNVSDDENLEKSRQEVKQLVDSLDSDDLRENKKGRDIASKKLSDIESKMGAFMGSSPKSFGKKK